MANTSLYDFPFAWTTTASSQTRRVVLGFFLITSHPTTGITGLTILLVALLWGSSGCSWELWRFSAVLGAWMVEPIEREA